MNRAERRKLKIRQSEPVINIKVSDIQNMKKQATDEAASIGFMLMLGIPTLVLRDKWSFGTTRLKRFIDQVLEMYDSFEKGCLTIDDIHKVLWEEVEIKIKK